MFFDKKKLLGKKLKSALERLCRGEICIRMTDGAGVPNKSRFGGKPYLPQDFAWPYYNGKGVLDEEAANRPLTFLCQIALEDIKPYDRENLLPPRGMLYFFYETETQLWGYDLSHRGCARVYYFENTDGFVLHDLPQDIDAEFCICESALEFSEKDSYPCPEEAELLLGVDIDWDEWEELVPDADDGEGSHKLLGYANLQQGAMQTECESIYRGYSVGSAEELLQIPEKTREDIKAHADDWVLLFQMGSDMYAEPELMWGDCGCIYFWIRREDLQACRFDRVWLILQCG